MPPLRDAAERFWEKVDVRGENECWPWLAGLSVGYGLFSVRHVHVLAHRWLYQQTVGPIPSGMHLDHTCHNADKTCRGGVTCPHRRCVNPRHLEVVTHQENNARAGNRFYTTMTACPRGHEYSGSNVITPKSGGRRCRTCENAAKRRYYQRKKEAMA